MFYNYIILLPLFYTVFLLFYFTFLRTQKLFFLKEHKHLNISMKMMYLSSSQLYLWEDNFCRGLFMTNTVLFTRIIN